jgi:MoaA/NifB/PqqE/SkfB family radical SAM enzyme
VAKIHYARVNANKEIVLPLHMAKSLGIAPGDEIRVEADASGLHLHPSIHTLKRVYVEATNKCNLTCSTCMRNVWDVSYGNMSEATFERILSGLEAVPDKPEIFLGGYGEPLSHPGILHMIEHAKQSGHRVSLISNGILLNKEVIHHLIELNLDMLWVSLDGASSECYSDVRLGDALPTVLANLTELRTQKFQKFGGSSWSGSPKLGIAFVAMRRNIHDLNQVIRLGTRLGAVEFSVSNVLAHNTELLAENLYDQSLDQVAGLESRPLIHMPLMDSQPDTVKSLAQVVKDLNRMEWTGSLLNQNTAQCPFIERGSLAVRWDGRVSPCLPLLYTHQHFLGERQRTSREYFVGHAGENTLPEIWNDSHYQALRKRLQDFDFSPCAFCNSCEMANENLEDCFGNTHPTCGGCLWARGLIRCP